MNNDVGQRYSDILDVLADYENKYRTLQDSSTTTIADIARLFDSLKSALSQFPRRELLDVFSDLKDVTGDFGIVFNELDQEYLRRIELERTSNDRKAEELERQDQLRQQAEDQEKRKIDRLNELTEEINNRLTDTSLSEAAISALETERTRIQEEIDEAHSRLNELNGNIDSASDVVNQIVQEANDQASEAREAARERKQEQSRNKIENFIKATLSSLEKNIIGLFTNATNRIVQAYEQNAGTMAASLNTSVSDISDMQNEVAKNLRAQSLSGAISRTEVFSEMSSLVNAGYTDETKLESTAQAIVTGRKIAPNLDFNQSTVKSLTNVFGSDFIEKFSAIQSAVQDTAGSTIGLKENLDKMMGDLEPVYRNADLQANALQGTSDVQATLSQAISKGDISESEAKNLESMIVELMDPNRAFKSSNTIVRMAAMNYNWSSADPAQALKAILSARSQAYSGVNKSMSSSGIISRSLLAGTLGDTNTMEAAYSPDYLSGIDMVETGDLSATYQSKLSDLTSGEYTTKKQKNQNIVENTIITDALSIVEKNFPILTDVVKTGITSISTSLIVLPDKIASAIVRHTSLLGGGSGSSIFSGVAGTGGSTGSLGGGIGAGGIGGRLVSTLGGVALIAGGVSSIANNWSEDQTLAQNLSGSGNNGGIGGVLQSTANWAMIGAGIGTIIPGLGTGIGAGIGAAAGLIAGLWANYDASKKSAEAQEANTLALQQQTKATEDLLGTNGITAVSDLEAKAYVAKGGGILHTDVGNYQLKSAEFLPGYASGLDFVPQDNYIARLHQGEAIVTANAAKKLREENPNFWNDSYVKNSSDVISALEKQTNSIVSAVRGNPDYEPMLRVRPKIYTIANNI